MKTGTIQLLYSIITAADWAKDPRTLYLAGMLSQRIYNEVLRKNHGEQIGQYQLQAPTDFTLASDEKELARTALKHFIAKGAITPSEWSLELQETLDLVD